MGNLFICKTKMPVSEEVMTAWKGMIAKGAAFYKDRPEEAKAKADARDPEERKTEMMATWGAADTNSDDALDEAEWKDFVEKMGANSEAACGWKPAYTDEFIAESYACIKQGCPDAAGITSAIWFEYLGVAAAAAKAAAEQ